MTSGAPALRVAIVGAGPRGLYALERLLSHAARRDVPLEVDVYDPTPTPGAGPVYAPDQPRYLRMNFAAGQVDAWWPGDGAVPRELRRSLVAWLEDADRAPSSPSPRVESAVRDVFDDGSPADAYLPRAVVGRYLHEAFALVERYAPPRVRLRRHRVVVTAIAPDPGGRRSREGSPAPEHDGWRVGSAGDARFHDEVLVAGAHRAVDRRALATDWRHAAPLIPAVFPVDRWLSRDRVPPGATVALRGLALTAIDAILALSEGRGGRFSATAGTAGLRYTPGPAAPVVVFPYSRTGRPMRPKPEAERFSRLAAQLAEAVTVATAQVPVAPQGAGQVAALTRVVGGLAGAVLDLVGAGPDEHERLVRWTGALAAGAAGPTERLPHDELRQGHATATGRTPLDAEAALGVAWRLVYPAVVERFGGSPLGVDGWRAFRGLAAELERVGFGPSPRNVAKLLALVDAGVVRLDHAVGGQLLDRGGGTELRSAAGTTSVDRVVDGVLPGPGIDRTGPTPLEGLLAAGHVAVAPGQRGVLVDPVDATALRHDGTRIAGLAAIGRSTEDATVGNDTLSRQLHPQVDRWAQRVVARAARAEASPDDRDRGAALVAAVREDAGR